MELTLNSTENGLGWSKHTIGHDKTDAEASKQSKSDSSHLVPFEHVPDRPIPRTDIGAQVTFNPYQVLFVGIQRCANSALYILLVLVPSPTILRLSYVASEQTVHCKCSALPFIVRVQHNDNIFDCDDNGKRPDDDRQGTKEVIVRGWLGEC